VVTGARWGGYLISQAGNRSSVNLEGAPVREYYAGGPSSNNLVLTGFLLHQQRQAPVDDLDQCLAGEDDSRFADFDSSCSALLFMADALKAVRTRKNIT
jgi:hypothetical protein